MDKLQKTSVVMMILFMLLIAFGSTSSSVEDDQQQQKPNKPSFTERLTNLLYISSSTSTSTSTSTPSSYWDKFKTLLTQIHAYFSPPNLDFRGSNEQVSMGSGGPGEKVKEAAARSVKKGKEAVEESAKSAAKMAGQTVQKTKDKLVKKSLSNKERQQSSSSEL